MIFTFYPDTIPDIAEAEVISGEASFHFCNAEYLLAKNGDEKRTFKILYECHYSPFKEAAIKDNLLFVGHEGFFYLYDLKAKRSLLILKMNGYFGHLYLDNNYLFVADAEGLFCIDNTGEIIWHNYNLGIDGVIIQTFTEDKIYGNCEWDPPGGWRDFVLDKRTGKSITPGIG